MGINGGSGEFGEWLRGKGSAARAAGSVHVHQAESPTLVGDVVVPALQALGIGAVLCLSLLVILPVLGVAWGLAWRWAVGAGAGSWAVATVRFVLGQRAVRRAPMELERDKLAWLVERDRGRSERREDREPWRLFRPPGAPRPELPARSELPARPVPSTVVEKSVEGVAPEVSPDIRLMYEFVIRVWPGKNVSRRACMDLGFSRSQWEWLVGGQPGRAGSESARGLLARNGVVEKRSSGWELVEGVTLEQVFAINDELLAYASAMAELTR